MDVPAQWLERLPDAVALACKEWDLELGEPFQPGGTCSWVAPVGADRVLKVGWLHEEAMHEVDQLRLWNGDGAVRLHESRVDGDTVLMLLERCLPGLSLKTCPELEQDEIVAATLRRMWRPGRRPFRPLWQMCAMWVDGMADTALDPALVRLGKQLFVELAAGDTLLLTDLHAGNILASTREPWLVIDPKPYVGDRHFDVLQHLLNCRTRLEEDPEALVRRMAGLLDLDRERILLWLFARCVVESGSDPYLASLAERLAP